MDGKHNDSPKSNHSTKLDSGKNSHKKTLPKNVVKPIWIFGLESRDAVIDSHRKSRVSLVNIQEVKSPTKKERVSTNKSSFSRKSNPINIPVKIERCPSKEVLSNQKRAQSIDQTPASIEPRSSIISLTIPKINHHNSSSNSDKSRSPNSIPKSPNQSSYFSDKSPRALSRNSYSSFDSGLTSRRESGKISQQNLPKVSKLLGPDYLHCLHQTGLSSPSKQSCSKRLNNSRRGSLDGILIDKSKQKSEKDDTKNVEKYPRSFSIHTDKL